VVSSLAVRTLRHTFGLVAWSLPPCRSSAQSIHSSTHLRRCLPLALFAVCASLDYHTKRQLVRWLNCECAVFNHTITISSNSVHRFCILTQTHAIALYTSALSLMAIGVHGNSELTNTNRNCLCPGKCLFDPDETGSPTCVCFLIGHLWSISIPKSARKFLVYSRLCTSLSIVDFHPNIMKAMCGKLSKTCPRDLHIKN